MSIPKAEIIIPPPPEDLGPIDAVEVGDRVAVLHTIETRDGPPGVSADTLIVAGFEDDAWQRRWVCVKGRDSKSRRGWLLSDHGARQYGMRREFLYYSANPKHIQLAKARYVREKAAADKAKAELDAKLILSRPIGLLLGDGWEDGGEHEGYHRSTSANALAELLTPAQLQTLAEWLSVA